MRLRRHSVSPDTTIASSTAPSAAATSTRTLPITTGSSTTLVLPFRTPSSKNSNSNNNSTALLLQSIMTKSPLRSYSDSKKSPAAHHNEHHRSSLTFSSSSSSRFQHFRRSAWTLRRGLFLAVILGTSTIALLSSSWHHSLWNSIGSPPSQQDSTILPLLHTPGRQYTLDDVEVYLRTYHADGNLAAAAVLSLLVFFPEATVTVVCPVDDVESVTHELMKRLRGRASKNEAEDSRGGAGHTTSTTNNDATSHLATLGVRVLPVGVGRADYANTNSSTSSTSTSTSNNWSSRESLIYDAFHMDAYVERPIILYTESDVLLLRRLQLSDVISPATGLPYVDRIDLGYLCRSMVLLSGMQGADTCSIHQTTARDAGTLFGVFNEYDFERKLPTAFHRDMFPALRQRIAHVHGTPSELERMAEQNTVARRSPPSQRSAPQGMTARSRMLQDQVLQRVLNYFAAHHGPHCTNGLVFTPLWLTKGTNVKDILHYQGHDTMSKLLATSFDQSGAASKADMDACLIGPSKPHMLGTYAHYFASHLHHPWDLLHQGDDRSLRRRYISLGLSSHRVRDVKTGALSAALERFIQRLYVERDPLLEELDAKDVNQTEFFVV